MKTCKRIILAGAFLPLMAAQAADTPTQPAKTPHQLTSDDAKNATSAEKAHQVTIAEVKHQADGTSVQIQGQLEKKQGEDVYLLRDDSGQIDAVIPAAVFSSATVAPGDDVTVLGSVDKKQTPPRLRVSHFEKR